MTPDQHTLKELRFETGDGHSLYVHDWGNKDAMQTIIFLHGGPGGGCSDSQKELFDPTKQRVVFFDQRGSGMSTPYGSLENNTTEHLIRDISGIADKLGLKTFVLVGGSWGSCLALAYGIENPERVSAMLLRGIYTGSQRENDFVEQGEFRSFYPEIWDRYLERTPAEHHSNPAAYHVLRVLGDNETAMRQSAYAMAHVEGALLRLDDRSTETPEDKFDPYGTRILVHYTSQNCFMPDRYIIKNAAKLAMPIWLVQGRYDMVCPPITAHELHAALPNSHLTMTIAGHSSSDRDTYNVMRTLVSTYA